MNLIMFYIAVNHHVSLTSHRHRHKENTLTGDSKVGGDPAPVVRWTRQGRESLPGTATVQHQGLAITNLHPSDQV